MLSYQEHYAQFLGYKLHQDGKLIICHSSIRDKIVSHRQPLILSFLNRQQIVVSLSFDLREKFHRLASTLPKAKRTPKQWFKIVDDFIFEQFKLYRVEHFIRMTVEPESFIIIKKQDCVRPLALADKNLLLNQGQLPERGKKFQDHFWKHNIKSIKESRSFGLIRGRHNLSWATVEPIECGAGNIAVATKEKQRKKGYGKLVVSTAVKWCFEHDILPIYYVKSDNVASIALARSLGFKPKNKEIIISHWPGDAEDRFQSEG